MADHNEDQTELTLTEDEWITLLLATGDETFESAAQTLISRFQGQIPAPSKRPRQISFRVDLDLGAKAYLMKWADNPSDAVRRLLRELRG